MFEDELNAAEHTILASLTRLEIPHPERVEWLPTPFEGRWGFGTNASFQAAALEARAGASLHVPTRAQEIAELLLGELEHQGSFASVEAKGGYLNVYIDPAVYAHRVTETILQAGADFGHGPPKKERVMVEYSQPNTHKAFHVGHLRNVILGGAMANILEFAGYDTVRANYIGDIGWHVVKWLWCYLHFHAGERPQGDHTRWMQDIYTEATRRVEADPTAEKGARDIFSRWEQRDAEILALWEKTRAWSLEGFAEIYKTLGEEFDVIFYESEVEESGKRIVERLIREGLAIDERSSGGPVVVKLDDLLGLENETYRVLVVLRSDGTSLYPTKDLPLAIRKFEQFNIDRSIYVIDVRQSLYLQQIFKLLELMGFKQAQDCYHLSYEIVNLPGNVTMSSREGTVVFFDHLLKEAMDRARAIVEEKNPALPADDKAEVSRIVALGAIKYPMLAVDNNKVTTFDWDRALDFEGQAAPYAQYAHVRANSILRKTEGIPEPATQPAPLEPREVALLETLARFPAEVQRSAEQFRPLIVANYVYELAKSFTEFYQHCPVLQADAPTRGERIRLVASARQVMENALGLLGIEAPEVM
jgi:arginyl-tRNA synthetase